MGITPCVLSFCPKPPKLYPDYNLMNTCRSSLCENEANGICEERHISAP